MHDRPITVAGSPREEQDGIIVGEIRHSQAPLLLCNAQREHEPGMGWGPDGGEESFSSSLPSVHFTRRSFSES